MWVGAMQYAQQRPTTRKNDCHNKMWCDVLQPIFERSAVISHACGNKAEWQKSPPHQHPDDWLGLIGGPEARCDANWNRSSLTNPRQQKKSFSLSFNRSEWQMPTYAVGPQKFQPLFVCFSSSWRQLYGARPFAVDLSRRQNQKKHLIHICHVR